MSKPLSLASFLLLTTAFWTPAAFAQVAGAPPAGTPSGPQPTRPDNSTADGQTAPQQAQPAQSATEPGRAATSGQGQVEISVPGEEIVVTGRATHNIAEASSQVVSVLSSADIARTGEGDIAGALSRVTGLSVVGNGFVYVRGLGDRYSLALLNGSPLPSPEPLKRVVPLDIFPTDVIASSLVQKSYSAAFPGEFGGGVINLTTKAAPEKPFLSISGSIGGDTETTGQLGYVYYGSDTDWSGFDDGTRDIPSAFKKALSSGNPILEGANFSSLQLSSLATTLVNARTTLLEGNDNIPVNFSGDLSAGASFDIGTTRLGLIASAGISNKWLTRQTLQQLSLDPDLANIATSFNRVITDDRAVVHGLLGAGLEFGQQKIRFTNLFIRDTIKQSRLAIGNDFAQQGNRDLLKQDTAWFERQLIDSQIVGEFKFGAIGVDVRGAYANSKRDAPYERSFTYVRTNGPEATGKKFVNRLDGQTGEATIAFSHLNEDLWSGGLDLTYELTPEIKLAAGYAYSDASRFSSRREFAYRPNNQNGPLPVEVTQERPDYLVSDYTVGTYGIVLQELTAQTGTAAFDASLTVNAGYGQVTWQVTPKIQAVGGVRFEHGDQDVTALDIFNAGLGDQFNTDIHRDYFLPSLTVTAQVAPEMQVRLSGSKTLARPQFRELIQQVFIDTDTNRVFQGNPSLVDSQLYNGEARFEYYYANDQHVSVAGFYKRIDHPIEAFSSILSSDITTSYANAPKADLFGVELEAQKYVPLDGWSGDFWAARRLVLIGNYTYTNSNIKVEDGDTTTVNNRVQPASNFFRDGSSLTGQSNHVANVQIGLEKTDSLSQQTILLSYASKRVTTRGPSGEPDVKEQPGFDLDFIARQGIRLFGVSTELKFEARNITSTKYQEYQELDGKRVYFNRYDVGASFSLGLGVRF